jgi:hypothetical protein
VKKTLPGRWTRLGSALAAGTTAALLVGIAQTWVLPASVSSADTVSDAATSSTVTVAARDVDPHIDSSPTPNLKVTVSQTKNLTSQAVIVSWTGGVESTRASGDSPGENFLQIAQCWGTDPNDPNRPDRTTCQYGLAGVTGSTRDNMVNSDKVNPQDEQYSAKTGYSNTTYVGIPFRSATGEVVNPIVTSPDGKKSQDPTVDPNNNQFFTNYTNNQIRWAGSDANGNGYSRFEIQTVMQSPGLGCGTPQGTGANVQGSSCWLVVIPRGVADNGQTTISTSGLLADSWQHAVGVKLQFQPVGVHCAIGADEKQLAGSELMASAIFSWQPKMCAEPGGSAYVFSVKSSSDAMTQELTDANAPMAFTSTPATDDTSNQLTYAPVAISGVVVSFAIDRNVLVRGKVPPEYLSKTQTPFDKINITPRLLAKLLTASYTDSLPPGDKSHLGYLDYLNPGHNARNITQDPDFLAVNDAEWKYQRIIGVGVADAVEPIGRSDLAQRVWSYIMSDPDAAAWLNGAPDPWGMVVNPYYSTNAELNPTGVPFSLPRQDFPKADPIEKPDTTATDPNGTGAINLVTWRPYISDFESGSLDVLRGDPHALGGWNGGAIPPAYSKTSGDPQGTQKVIALSTAASANRYKTLTASLENPAGEFVPPNVLSMQSAIAAATPNSQNQNLVEFNFNSDAAKAAPGAYPLTMPIYAVTNPTLLNPDLRTPYASLIAFAALKGQVTGTEVGQLPFGYAPLTPGLVQQSIKVTSLVFNGVSQSSTTPPTIEPPVVPTTPGETGSALQVLLGARTPMDPAATVQQNAVPIAFMGGMVSTLVYPRIRRRKVITK